MKQYRKIGRPEQRGVALVAALMAAFVAATMIAVLMTLSQASNRRADVDRYKAQARYAAEGAVEAAKKDLQEAIANWRPVPAEGSVVLDGQNVSYTVVPTGLDQAQEDGAGIQTLVTGFEVLATGSSQFATAQVHRILNARATPIFQFAVFYTDDLEIFPGPSMTLGGRVHANGDLYVGCGGTLTVDTNYMRAVGGIYRERKDRPGVSGGTVKVRKWVENPYDPAEPLSFFKMYSKGQMDSLGVSTVSGYDSHFTDGLDLNGDGDFYDTDEWMPWAPGALDFWGPPTGYSGGTGNTVMSEDHGVGEAVVPQIGSIAMYEEREGGSFIYDSSTDEYLEVAAGSGTHDPGFFHAKADLVVITKDDGSWDAFDADGFSVKGALAGVVTQDDMYDARQADGSGDRTPITQIDVAALNASGVFPTNGLLYTSHHGMGEGTDAKGVVLTNGSELAAPLTVVTEGALYVHGDYNTVNKKGSSVIGDAVNLLSNAWDGSKSPGNLPVASDTTFNVAIVTGNHETHVNDYNGGLENLPRFHESWSNKKCNIVGSFVNTWFSQYATAKWRYGGDRYKAPKRNWSYDTAFNTVANLPPYTPMAVSAEDIVTW